MIPVCSSSWRCYLDELERRDPAGFRRWINDGARAAGDPARYITRECPSANGTAQDDVVVGTVAENDPLRGDAAA